MASVSRPTDLIMVLSPAPSCSGRGLAVKGLAAAFELGRDLVGEEAHRPKRKLRREPRQRHQQQNALVSGGVQVTAQTVSHLGRGTDERPAVGQIVVESPQPKERAVERARHRAAGGVGAGRTCSRSAEWKRPWKSNGTPLQA